MSPLPTLVSSLLIPDAVLLAPRQATTTIVTSSQSTNSCPGQYSGGTLAGAIVGTFLGTLLVLYLFNSLMENPVRGPTDVVVERKVRTGGSRRRHRSRSGGSYASSVRRPSRVYSTRS